MAKLLRSQLEKRIHAVEPAPVLDKKVFPWATSIEVHHVKIREEVEFVLKNTKNIINFDDVLPGQRALYQGKLWKSFFLKILRDDVIHHQKICPVTTEALKNIPGIINAFFSILEPGTHIPPHRGPHAGILRYHLGVIIPEGDVGIKVGGQICRWKEGESLFFDDSFEHEAWNLSNSLRVILFVDFIRPLPIVLSVFNQLLLKVFEFSEAAKTAHRRVLNNQVSSN
jgi:beta-hydroxylase